MNNYRSLFSKNNLSVLKAIPVIFLAIGLFVLTPLNIAASAGAKKAVLQDDFEKKFREGRDMIDKEDWAKATEIFAGLISKYPTNKSSDAALYWLALCYKKLKMVKEANETIDRLVKDYPNSSWADDARVMKMEVVGFGSRDIYRTTLDGAKIYSTDPDAKLATTYEVDAARLEGYLVSENIVSDSGRTPLAREDEIKLAAFQSLLAADPKRGIDAMIQIFQPESKAGESLKLEVLRAIRRPRVIYDSFPGALTTAGGSSSNGTQITPLLKEPLLKIFQKETNVKIRRQIVYVLASLNDPDALNYLVQLYSSENDKELKKSILNSFVQAHGLFVGRPQAAGGSGGSGNPTQRVEFTKLLEIMRMEKDAELRSLALKNLQYFAGWSTNPQIIPILSDAYDAETSEEFKMSIIQTLARVNQNQASRKLLDIAKTEKSDKLKIEAINALGRSKDPEALKYLEELIK